MNSDDALRELADIIGILPSYRGFHGEQIITSVETQMALLAANGINVGNDAEILASLQQLKQQRENRWFPDEIIINSHEQTPLQFGLGGAWQLIEIDAHAEVNVEVPDIVATGEPADYITLPALLSGVYQLQVSVQDRQENVTVLVAPQQLPTIDAVTRQSKLWGMSLALYGLTSERNAGLGDFQDLCELGKSSAKLGCGFLGINPVHNMGFSDDESISPYSPSHRGFLNIAYIALDQIPGLENNPQVSALLQGLNAQYAAGDSDIQISYRLHKKRHKQALEPLYQIFKTEAGFEYQQAFSAFARQGGAHMDRFAQYETLSETQGCDWRMWTSDHLPDNTENCERKRFHIWLQWVANEQLRQAQHSTKQAGAALGLYLDLAVGPRRDGGESWCEQAVIAEGVSVGAPPDHLSPEGQKWELAAFSPRKLQAQHYSPLRRMLAQTMRHAGVVRIDHMLGLNRSFWIPDGEIAGGYIRQPFESLLAVIKIEAERHQTMVIGEDLGLVPQGFRETMKSHGFYGYSVLQYEKDEQGCFRDPTDSKTQVLSCFGTHDTPTIKGFESARDIDWWYKLGWIDQQAADRARQDRQRTIEAYIDLAKHRSSGLAESEQCDVFRDVIHGALAHSPAAMICIQLDDILGQLESQNLPGTITEHPNWRRKYKTSVRGLQTNHSLLALSAAMKQAQRALG
jgi:4-alpha-glucanotransferase